MDRSKIDDSLQIKIGKIWNSAEGTTEKFSIDALAKFKDSEFEVISNLTADVFLVKLKNEISAIITNTHVKVRRKCEKCLSTYSVEVDIESAEREFISEKIDVKDDPNENFQIDFNNMTIDLLEMIRQEIILHFPLISVCSKSCKGLCLVCGKNRNRTLCKCKIEETDTQKPFKNLKKIIKN